MARLKEFYKAEVVPQLQKAFEYKNVMEVPKITKVCLNIGAGDEVIIPSIGYSVMELACASLLITLQE